MQLIQLKIHEEYSYKPKDYLNVFSSQTNLLKLSAILEYREKGYFLNTVDLMIFCLTNQFLKVKEQSATQARHKAFVIVRCDTTMSFSNICVSVVSHLLFVRIHAVFVSYSPQTIIQGNE